MPTFELEVTSELLQRRVPIPARDGTVLRATVYRRDDNERHPVLLVRTPYGEAMTRTVPVQPALDGGFAVVIQDCRGTGESDGDFVPFASEADDGVDTIAWCAAQPWSDGTVGMYGSSYQGMVQLAAAGRAPEALKGLVPSLTPDDYHSGVFTSGGAIELGMSLFWYTLKSEQTLEHRARGGEDVSRRLSQLFGLTADPHAGYDGLPIRDSVVGSIMPAWRRWADHETRDEFWDALSYADQRAAMTTPALHVGGWFDLFITGTVDNYVTLTDRAATAHARRNQRLVVGPWTHADQTGTAGELFFGRGADATAIGLERQQLEFLRRVVAGDDAPNGPRVRIFVMGHNVWRDEEAWPLARTRYTPWYLHAGGTLSPEEPVSTARPSTYTYDPRDPMPTVGGQTLMSGGSDGGQAWQPGPRDQRVLDGRTDVLTFTSEVLAEDVEVTGHVTVTLSASTSVTDTDFTAKLIDVWPDGRAMGVVDGIVRARFRHSVEAPEPVTPGKIESYVIRLAPTSQVFKAGHRIRLDVSSSNFPRYDRNSNSGKAAGSVTTVDFVEAVQTVHHSADHPSFVVLPIIPES